ncbi:MAG: polysaccharide deacetylase family protein [Eubacterium sp.]|nr:polysaccharide deacetylase family protein [Eubacterium sp.]
MKKGIQYVLLLAVVIVLGVGIFSVARRLTGTDTARQETSAGSKTKEEKTDSEAQETTTEKKVDNSVPMTDLKIKAPQGYLRVGKSMKLKIETQPADATNTELEWTCSEGASVTVTKDGELTPDPGSEKKTVTVTAKATDGSNLTQSFQLRILPAIDPSKPMVAITFDDGPYPDTTNPMLDALEENYALATFFCLGEKVGYYPEVVQRELDLGMEVGTHTFSHKQLTALGADELDTEIKKSLQALKDAVGVTPKLMRPPYGSANKSVLKAVGSYGLCCMNWSLDTEDWKTKNADATYKMVMTATDGDVILLHDIHQYNVDAVKRFVPDLMAAGFQLVTVPELYENRGETLDPGTIHFRTDPTTESSGETTAASSEDGAVPASEEGNN